MSALVCDVQVAGGGGSEFYKTLSEPWFSLIKLGIKKCEGRLNSGDFARMRDGDYITFENNNFDFRRKIRCRITEIKNYPSFAAYLEAETLGKCLPGMDNMDEGLGVYYKYFKKADERTFGVRAFHMEVV